MKAIRISRFGGPEVLEVVETGQPVAGPSDVLLRVAFEGVNPVDKSIMSGRWQWVPLPHIPGSEIAGTIIAHGSQVSAATPPVGARVAVSFRRFCGQCWACLRGHEENCVADPRSATAPDAIGLMTPGGYAEYVVVPAKNVIAVPDNVSLAAACTGALDGVTAWHLVDQAGIEAGDRVMVVGATGGVGLYAIQIARQRGATVTAVSGNAAVGDLLHELGAELVIDRRSDDVAAAARQHTGGRGMDVVLDPTGAASWPASIAALAPMGRYATCGILTGPEVTLNLAPFYAQQQKIIGSTGGTRHDLVQVLGGLSNGRLRSVVWRTFSLDDAPAAVAALTAPERLGKVLLEIGGEG